MSEMTLPPRHRIRNSSSGVWGRARCLSVTEAPHNTEFYKWMGKKHFCFFQTAETGKQTPNSIAWKAAVLTTTLGPPPSGFESRPGRMFVIESAHTVLQTVLRSGVYNAVYDTLHYKEALKSFDKCPDFGLPPVAILPWLCRKRRKAIFTPSIVNIYM